MHRSVSVLLLLFLALVSLLSAPLRAAPKQRNVVLIVADDLGLELGCYGNSVIKTPAIDALSAQGTRFDHAFCAVSSCSPSRSVILSGLQCHANGMYGLQHATHKQNSHEWVQGLPNLLHAAGYRTCSIGKYHVAPEASYHFDTYANQGVMANRSVIRMAENAEAWLKEDAEKPFFLYFCFSDPHRAGTGFANNARYPGVNEVKYDPKTLPMPWFLPDWPETRADLAEYYQSVSRMDQGVGRLMKALRDTGHADDTLVVFLSDNGIPFPGAKTNMYDPGMRLPLIARAPEQKQRGAVSTAMVSWTDITPTILEWTGAKAPTYPLHGQSFLASVSDPSVRGADEVYGSYQFHEITMYYPMRMLRTRTHKYILNLANPLPYPTAEDLFDSPTWQAALRRKEPRFGERPLETLVHRPREELYDLQRDPHELHNLAEDSASTVTLNTLRAKLRAWQDRTADPWLIKYRHE